MAVLTSQQRFDIWASVMRGVSDKQEVCQITKPDLRAAIDAVDTFLETNAAAINNAFPEPAKSGLTVAQKASLVAYVALKRWGG